MDPFDDIRALLADLPAADDAARARTAAVFAGPGAGGLGRLEAVALWLAGWSGRTPPQPIRPIIALYAGAHSTQGAPSAADLRARLEALAAGGSPVNGMAQRLGAGLDAFDLAVDRPVADPALGATMSARECAATLAFGMEALAKAPDLLLLGDIGGGGAGSARAVALALDQGGDPFEALRTFGGREMAAIAGAIVAARVQRTPVVLDGFVATTAAAVLQAAQQGALEHCRFAHVSTETGHRDLLQRLGAVPLLDLELASPDGVGAAAALALIQLACSVPAR